MMKQKDILNYGMRYMDKFKSYLIEMKGGKDGIRNKTRRVK